MSAYLTVSLLEPEYKGTFLCASRVPVLGVACRVSLRLNSHTPFPISKNRVARFYENSLPLANEDATHSDASG